MKTLWLLFIAHAMSALGRALFSSLPVLMALFLAQPARSAQGTEKPNVANLPALPDWAVHYQLDPESISPDGKWGVLIGKDIQIGGQFLIHLPDFTHLLDLPTIGMIPRKSSEYGLVVNWAADSSASVMYSNGKFGVEHVLVVVPGRPGYLIDLEHEIRREMDADFAASKAVGWNESYDYYLDDGTKSSWIINQLGQVIVNCNGYDNPRMHPGLSWQGHFQGLYDIHAEKFVKKKYERTFCGYYKPQ
jgi:hypothetical protein